MAAYDRCLALQPAHYNAWANKARALAALDRFGAALAAYFGYAPKVRAIRFGSQSKWATAARERVHDRSVPHVR